MSIPKSMKGSRERFTRDSWLALALDVLAEEGRAKIKIEYLAIAPVSKCLNFAA